MTGARALLALSLPLLSLALLAASCGGEPARGSPAGDASPTAITPREGTIVYYSPKPRAGSFNRGARLSPSIITITTEAGKGRRPDEDAHTSAGTIPKEATGEKPTEPDVRQKIFEEARANAARVVSSQDFKELWGALDAMGVFKLPRYRGGIPPEDKPSLRLSAEGKTWIFLRPTDAPSQLPRDKEELKEVREAWINATTLIVTFTS